jgi:hypothetical protein
MATIEGEHFTSNRVPSGNDDLKLKVFNGHDTVRNCAFTHDGSGSVGKNQIHLATSNPVPSGETQLLEHCYFSGGRAVNGLWVDGDTKGTLVVRNCTFEQVNDALYTDPIGKSPGGTVIVENCTFIDCNISALRLGVGQAVNVAIFNTGNVPTNGGDQINSRGAHQFYADGGGHTVTVENAHIDVTQSNTGGAASAVNLDANAAQWTFRNSQIRGTRSDGGNATYEGVGTNPTRNAASGCPLSVAEALDGTSSAAGLPGDGGVDYTPPSEAITSEKDDLTVRPT